MQHKFILLIILILYFQTACFSQTRDTYSYNNKKYSIFKTSEKFPGEKFQEKRFALVVAISHYANIPQLENDESDADSMTVVLNNAGFDVMKVISSPTKAEFLEIISACKTYYGDNDYNIALFYFSGHGANLASTQMLLPSDFPDIYMGDISDDSLSSKNLGNFMTRSVLLSQVVSCFNRNKTKKVISIIDACRSSDYIIKTFKNPMYSIPVEVMKMLNEDGKNIELGSRHAIFLPVVSGEPTPSTSPNSKNSFFTYYVIRSFSEKPATISDLGKIIKRRMIKCTQKPVIKNFESEYEFMFYPEKEIDPDRDTKPDIELDVDEVAIVDYQLGNKENWKFSGSEHHIGDSWTNKYGNFNSILNPENFVVEGLIDFYPTVLFYFGGDANDRNSGALCVEISGILNDNALFQNGNEYRITDFDNLNLSLRYGFIENGEMKSASSLRMPFPSSKDWQNLQFRLTCKDKNLHFEFNQAADEGINGSFSIKASDGFTKNVPGSRSIFSISNRLDNVLPGYVKAKHWNYRTIFINKLSCTSRVSKKSECYKKITPSFSKGKMVTDYFLKLKEDNRDDFVKHTGNLTISDKYKLIPEQKINPADCVFIEFESEMKGSSTIIGSSFSPDYDPYLCMKLDKEDLLAYSMNGEGCVANNRFMYIKKENAIYISLLRYGNLKILFTKKAISFFDQDTFRGSVDYAGLLEPITIEAVNRKNHTIVLKKLTLRTLK
jgi:hypothetical protein